MRARGRRQAYNLEASKEVESQRAILVKERAPWWRFWGGQGKLWPECCEPCMPMGNRESREHNQFSRLDLETATRGTDAAKAIAAVGEARPSC